MSAQRKGGWGSFLNSAVAGLESRLDTILAEDDHTGARSKAADAAAKPEGAEKTDADKQRPHLGQGG